MGSNKNRLSRKIKNWATGSWQRHGRPFLKALGNRTLRRIAKQQIKKELENGD